MATTHIDYEWENDFSDYLLECNKTIHTFEHYKVNKQFASRIQYSVRPQQFERLEGAEFLLAPNEEAKYGFKHRCFSFYEPDLIAEILGMPEAFPGDHDWLKHVDEYGAPIDAMRCVPDYHIDGSALDLFVDYMQKQGHAVSFSVTITNSAVDLTMRVNENDISVHITADVSVRTSYIVSSAHCIAIATYLKA